MKAENIRVCEKGHSYYKTSDCQRYPICDKENNPESGLPIQTKFIS